jgi:heme/copper-type cytochrome/quinol oxidase subunit 1
MSSNRERENNNNNNRDNSSNLSLTWTNRFIYAAIIQGAIIVGLTIFLVFSQISFLKPEISRVIAAGGAGTWFTFGYIMYIVVGVIGVAVSALFYYYLEKILAKPYNKRLTKLLAWTHLLLMNIGTTTTMGMLMYAGYIGGAAMLPENIGGKGFNGGQAHQILAHFIEPISIAILILLLGIILGGVGFLLTYNRKGTKSREII